MTISDLFSKRQKRLSGDLPDVYMYDNIPNSLRVQIVHLWDEGLGNKIEYSNTSLPAIYKLYRQIVGTLCREYGMFTLASASYFQDESRNFRYELQAFFLAETNTERIIDVIESSFIAIDRMTRNSAYKGTKNFDTIADKAINELNKRFKEHSIGYKFEAERIVRIDSELIHSEVIKPALMVLKGKHFKKAEQAFLKAHDHYLKENHKKAMDESLKAFLSTIKAICNKNGWEYDPKAGSKKMIELCLGKNLIPIFWHSQIQALGKMLENGFPTESDKSGKQGKKPEPVPNHFVSYILHMTASTIVFLDESDRADNT